MVLLSIKGKLQEDGQRQRGDCWARPVRRVWSGQESGVQCPPGDECPTEADEHASEAAMTDVVGPGLGESWRSWKLRERRRCPVVFGRLGPMPPTPQTRNACQTKVWQIASGRRSGEALSHGLFADAAPATSGSAGYAA